MKYSILKRLIFVILLSKANTLFAQNLLFPITKTKVIYDAVLKDEGRSSDESVKVKHFTYTSEYLPLYISADVKIIKCINFILYGVSKDDLLDNVKDTSYLVIEDNCKYFNIHICDPSTEKCDTVAIASINQFINNSIPLPLLREKLKDPFLNSQKDTSFYYDETFNSTLSTKRTHFNEYKLSFKSHNELASYNISLNKGFTNCSYYWGRIVSYKVSLKIKKVLTL